MLRCATTLTASLVLLFASLGCAGEKQVLGKLGEGFERQVQEKGEKFEQSIESAGSALEKSAQGSIDKLNNFFDSLTARYQRDKQRESYAAFKSGAPLAAPAVPAEKLEAYRPTEIQTHITNERVLESRGLRLLWKLPLDGSGVKSADMDDGLLYIVTGDNVIYCIDFKTGLTRWVYTLDRRPDTPLGFNNQYVVVSSADTIHVIDKRSGLALNVFETSTQPASRPFCTQNFFMFGTWSGKVAGFQFDEGHPRWMFGVGDPVFAQPVMHEAFAFACDDTGEFHRYNLSLNISGETLKIGGRPMSELVATKDMMFVANDDYEFVAISMEKSEISWKHDSTGRFLDGPWLSPGEDVVFYSGENDGLYSIAAASGNQRWHFPGGIKPVAVFDKNIFILRNDGMLCNADLASGTLIWAEPIAPFITMVGHLQSEVMVLVAADGQLYAVAPKK